MSSAQQKLCLIPEPKSLEFKQGYYVIGKANAIVIQADGNKSLNRELHRLAELLRQILDRSVATLTAVRQRSVLDGGTAALKEECNLKIGIDSSRQAGKDELLLKLRPLKHGESEDAFLLEVREDGLAIESAGASGIFYGIQTLAQILRQTKGKKDIPCLEIRDWPSLPLRGIHIDLKYQMPKFQYLLEIIDTLSRYKINHVLLEYENKFPFKNHPLLSSRLALSESEVKRLVAYCKDRYIKIIPILHSINWIGYILKHKKYAHLREKQDSIYQACPLNPGTFELFTELYNEMAAYHEDAEYFHVGGDELHHLGVCPKCRSRVEKEGRFGLYSEYILKVCAYVRRSGKIPVIWGDMLLDAPLREIKKIPKDIVMIYWDYWSKDQKTDWVSLGSVVSEFKGAINGRTIKKISQNIYRRFRKYWDPGDGSFPEKFNGFPYLRYYQDIGFKTVGAPAIQCSGDNYNCPRYFLHLHNIAEFCKAAVTNGSLGVINTNWVMHRIPWEITWPGHICAAEFSWSGNQIGLDDFEKKFVKNYWGITETAPFDILRDMGVSADFRWVGASMDENLQNAIAGNLADKTLADCLPYTHADLFLKQYPVLRDEIRAFEETPRKTEILASMPKLASAASDSAGIISKLTGKAGFNKMSLEHIRLVVLATEHKALQAFCFHKCEELLETGRCSGKELDECITLLKKLLIQLRGLSLETRRLLSLNLPKEEVDDGILRRYVQEEEVMRDYLRKLRRN